MAKQVFWDSRNHYSNHEDIVQVIAVQLHEVLDEFNHGYISRSAALVMLDEIAEYAKSHDVPFNVELMTALFQGSNWEDSSGEWEDSGCTMDDD